MWGWADIPAALPRSWECRWGCATHLPSQCGREAEGCSLCSFQLMSAIQKGHVSGSRLAVLMKTAEENLRQRVVIPVDRSGGGL